jgi:NADH-quinone oxidoreductase subunit C
MKLEEIKTFLQGEAKVAFSFEEIADPSIIVLRIQPDDLEEMVTFLRANKTCNFDSLIDITCVDYPDRDKRFELIYNFLSLSKNRRLIIKTSLEEEETISSLAPLYNASIWYEREVFDLYGVFFEDNPDLRRILTDYGFQGHPLRKDFPLTGYVEVRYDDEQKKVIYEPVTLQQEYRDFDYISPWEGTKYTEDIGGNK